jgi:hypothetical protein
MSRKGVFRLQHHSRISAAAGVYWNDLKATGVGFSGQTGIHFVALAQSQSGDALQFIHACKHDSSRAADVGCHAPPRGVRMPRSFNAAAIARTLVNSWMLITSIAKN